MRNRDTPGTDQNHGCVSYGCLPCAAMQNYRRSSIGHSSTIRQPAPGWYTNAGVGSQGTEVNSSSDMYRLIRLEAYATRHPYELNKNLGARATRCERRRVCFIFILLSFHPLYRDKKARLLSRPNHLCDSASEIVGRITYLSLSVMGVDRVVLLGPQMT